MHVTTIHVGSATQKISEAQHPTRIKPSLLNQSVFNERGQYLVE